MKPIVTIIMATFNRAHFILEAVASIQNQKYTEWECLIIDDGGTDNTKEVIIPILERDRRFIYLERPEKYKKGLPGCRNYGLDIAKGTYIIFFDDDDIVHPDNLKIGVEVIEKNLVDFYHYQKKSFEDHKPIMVSTPITILKSIDKDDIEKVVTHKIGLASCTVLWKKKCFETIRFNEVLSYAEEWECYSKIILENFKGIIINNILYYNRKHSNSNTGEFYAHNFVRRESYVKAILLVIQNLKEKQLLSVSLKRYFVILSKDYSEYLLFETILNTLELSIFEKFKWKLLYAILPLRLFAYKLRKKY